MRLVLLYLSICLDWPVVSLAFEARAGPARGATAAAAVVPRRPSAAAAAALSRSLRLRHRTSHHHPSSSSRLWNTDYAMQQEVARERPTETMVDPVLPKAVNAKPKIVVLGATGRLGRQVVRHLLDMPYLDATIIAFVRDYDKACRVLYDDFVVAKRSQGVGPTLQIVLGNLVPPDELPGHRAAPSGDNDEEDDENDDEEKDWRRRADSAARFYGVSRKEFDNRELMVADNADEALEEAINGSSCIISCVGDVRPTNIWTDVLARPFWRLLKRDVSSWCKDGRHPFYVHFQATRKVLRLAEHEQKRREANMSCHVEGEDCTAPRIRLVRISDASVAAPPWQLVPLVVNVFQSMAFRYHSMAENLLASSTLIDTITLRAGDMVDEERNVTTTSLQVAHTGCVASPAIVGTEDVAALAVASGLFPAKREKEPFHYCLACRWVSEDLAPFPAQGKKSDGFNTASLCIQSAVRKLRKRRYLVSKSQKELKPYGPWTAIPLYLGLTLLAASLWLRIAYYIGATSTNPVFRALAERLAIGTAYLSSLCKPALQGMISWLIRRPTGGHYFSF